MKFVSKQNLELFAALLKKQGGSSKASDIDTESATAGQLLGTDGSGNTEWESPMTDEEIDEMFKDPCLQFSSPSSFTLKTANTTKNWDGTLEYSTDESTWHIWDGTEISSGANNTILLKGTGNTYISNNDNMNFVLTGSNISCSGNIMTLLDYSNIPTVLPSANLFYRLFGGCTSLISAPELPVTTLTTGCYGYMFYQCTSLASAPKLPATTLANSCYNNMFVGCTSLASVPKLPATTLANACYYRMFTGCSLIKLSTTQSADYPNAYTIPSQGTGTTASNALTEMFSGTGGSFTGTPSINTTYYTSNEVV